MKNPNKLFDFDETRKGAYLEDVLTHNARLHVIDGERYAKCLENVVRVYSEFFKNKDEYRAAASDDFKVCVAAHRDMKDVGFI